MHTAQIAGLPLAERLAMPRDRSLNKIFFVMFIIQVSLGIALHIIDPPVAENDFFNQLSPEYAGTLVIRNALPALPTVEKTVPAVTGTAGRVAAAPAKAVATATGNGTAAGKGSRGVIRTGILGILNGKVEGYSGTGSTAGILGAGMTEDIDAVIGSMSSLKTGNGPVDRRRGKAGIGYGDGMDGSFGSGTGGTLDGLISQMGTSSLSGKLPSHRRGDVSRMDMGGDAVEHFTGDRNRDEIRAVVMERLGGIKHAYNVILRSNPGLQGKISVAFVIAASGRVISAQVVSRTMRCTELEMMILRKIRTWRFRSVEGGDFKVEYPFVFSPGM